MTKRDEILQAIDDAIRGAQLHPKDVKIRAMRGNIAQVWLADYQADREELQEELTHVRNALLVTAPSQRNPAIIAKLNRLIAKLG